MHFKSFEYFTWYGIVPSGPNYAFRFRNISSVYSNTYVLKGALLSLRQFLATESPLKMMKNTFYFTLKALFVLKIFKFLS